MSVLIIRQDGNIKAWMDALQRHAPDIKFYNYLDDHPKDEIEAAMVWKHPPGIFNNYPGLRYLASFGAGVDFIFEDEDIDRDILITRVVDPFLASDMSEFVLSVILSYLKNLTQYGIDQQKSRWQPKPYSRIAEKTVGIMGLGALGIKLANDLNGLKFSVVGWSNSVKNLDDIVSYAGQDELSDFLTQSQILVCLLPLTPETSGILNNDLFVQLPQQSYVINVARGGHLVDADLISAIDHGHLSGACLDVYHEEPLAPEHPFWAHPKIFMTPHVASVSDIESVVPQLLDNYRRFKKGLELKNQVSTIRGY